MASGASKNRKYNGEILRRRRIPERAIVKKGGDLACPLGEDSADRRRHPGGGQKSGPWRPPPGYAIPSDAERGSRVYTESLAPVAGGASGSGRTR